MKTKSGSGQGLWSMIELYLPHKSRGFKEAGNWKDDFDLPVV